MVALDEDAGRRRFLREARIAAGLSHPNVVTVYDSGADDEGPYLVMELIEGPTMAERALEPRSVRGVGRDLARALAAIHDAGIVHRDVKPANVILSARGPVLTDFGLSSIGDASTQLTIPGQVLATPAYAAPEVLAGNPATPASDVFSLAVVVVEALSGARRDPSAPMPVTGDGVLDRTLAAALSTRPSDRPDAEALAIALDPGSSPASTLAPPVAEPTAPITAPTSAPDPTISIPAAPAKVGSSSGDGRRTGFVWAGVVVLLGLSAVAWSLGRDGSNVESTATSVEASPASSVETTAPPTTTAPIATTAAPPTTLVVRTTTTEPVDPVAAAASAFSGAIADLDPPVLRPKDERKIFEELERLLGDPSDKPDKRIESIEKALRSIRDGDAADEARRLFDDLVVAMTDAGILDD
jgi:serine/threonine protein kinase